MLSGELRDCSGGVQLPLWQPRQTPLRNIFIRIEAVYGPCRLDERLQIFARKNAVGEVYNPVDVLATLEATLAELEKQEEKANLSLVSHLRWDGTWDRAPSPASVAIGQELLQDLVHNCALVGRFRLAVLEGRRVANSFIYPLPQELSPPLQEEFIPFSPSS